MAQVRPSLYVGSFRFADDRAFLKKEGITHLLAVGERLKEPEFSDKKFLDLKVSEGSSATLRPHTQKLRKFLSEGTSGSNKALVYCKDGRSLSAAATLIFLILEYRMRLSEAIAALETVVQRIVILPEIMVDVKRAETEMLLNKMSRSSPTPVTPRREEVSPPVSARPSSAGRERRAVSPRDTSVASPRRPLSAGSQRRPVSLAAVAQQFTADALSPRDVQSPRSARSLRTTASQPLPVRVEKPLSSHNMDFQTQRAIKPPPMRFQTVPRTVESPQARTPNTQVSSASPATDGDGESFSDQVDGLVRRRRIMHEVMLTPRGDGSGTPRSVTSSTPVAKPVRLAAGMSNPAALRRSFLLLLKMDGAFVKRVARVLITGSPLNDSTAELDPQGARIAQHDAIQVGDSADGAAGATADGVVVSSPKLAGVSMVAQTPRAGESNTRRVIVLDIGARNIRAGWMDEDTPAVTFAAVVGRPLVDTQTLIRTTGSVKDVYVGDEALANSTVLDLVWPAQLSREGATYNIDALLCVVREAYNRLGADPREHAVILTDPLGATTAQRQQLADMFFTTLGIPALRFESQPLAALYASDVRTGVCLMLGESQAYACPVYENIPVVKAAVHLGATGAVLTNYLQLRLLRDRGYQLTGPHDRQTCVQVKEALCYVSLAYGPDRVLASKKMADFEEEFSSSSESGKVSVVLGDERFRCPELIFQPKLFTCKPSRSVQEAVYEAVMKADANLRSALLQKIVIAGGTAQLRNLARRVRSELATIVATGVPGTDSLITGPKGERLTLSSSMNVIATSGRDVLVWRGAALHGRDDRDSGDQSRWIVRNTFFEKGVKSLSALAL